MLRIKQFYLQTVTVLLFLYNFIMHLNVCITFLFMSIGVFFYYVYEK